MPSGGFLYIVQLSGQRPARGDFSKGDFSPKTESGSGQLCQARAQECRVIGAVNS